VRPVCEVEILARTGFIPGTGESASRPPSWREVLPRKQGSGPYPGLVKGSHSATGWEFPLRCGAPVHFCHKVEVSFLDMTTLR